MHLNLEQLVFVIHNSQDRSELQIAQRIIEQDTLIGDIQKLEKERDTQEAAYKATLQSYEEAIARLKTKLFMVNES